MKTGLRVDEILKIYGEYRKHLAKEHEKINTRAIPFDETATEITYILGQQTAAASLTEMLLEALNEGDK